MDTVIVTKHAKKRIKQRINKNYQQIADCAFLNGISHNKLKGKIKRYIDSLAIKNKEYQVVSCYKIHNNCVFLFNKNILITVLHIPSRFIKTNT
jgi:hypothetical protein